MSEAADTPPINRDVVVTTSRMMSFQFWTLILKYIFLLQNTISLSLWETVTDTESCVKVNCRIYWQNTYFDKFKSTELIQSICSQNTKELNWKLLTEGYLENPQTTYFSISHRSMSQEKLNISWAKCGEGSKSRT